MTDDVTRPFDARPAVPPPAGRRPVGRPGTPPRLGRPSRRPADPCRTCGAGSRRLSRGLIAYGVIGLIVAVIGLALLLYANTRIDAAGDRVEASVGQLTTTLDRTAQALHDASTTAATFNTHAGPDADRGRGGGRHDRQRADQPPEPRERAPIGQHPRGVAARRRGQRGRRDRQLDRGSRLEAHRRSPTAWPPAATPWRRTRTRSGRSATASPRPRPTGCDPASSRIRSPTSTSRSCCMLFVLTAWAAVPAVGALVFGVWLRRRLRGWQAAGNACDGGAASASAARAAGPSARRACPLIPWTPPPGGVDDEHRYRPGADAIRVERRPRPEDELADVLDPAVDVAADVVRVVRLHRGRARASRGRGSGRGSPGAKRSTCASIRSVMSTVEPGGHVAVRPGRRLARRRPRRVPRRVLDEQHVRPLRVAAGGDLRLRRGDLVERAAEVDRRRPARPLGGPRDRAVERPVDLEHARAVAEPLGAPAAPRRQPVAGDRHELARRHVEQDGTRPAAGRRATSTRWPVTTSPPAASSSATSAVGDGGRPAADHRPADRVGERRRGRARTRHSTGDRGGASSGPRCPRTAPAPARRRTGRGPGPSPIGAPAARTARAPAGVAGRGRPAAGSPGRACSTSRTSGPNSRRQARPSAAAEPVRRWPRTDRSRTAARPPSSGWATGASGWTSSTPRAARSIDGEERRGDGQRQDRRAHVVAEAGERQLGGPRPAAGRRGGLVDTDRAPGTGQRDRRGQAVRARPRRRSRRGPSCRPSGSSSHAESVAASHAVGCFGSVAGGRPILRASLGACAWTGSGRRSGRPDMPDASSSRRA